MKMPRGQRPSHGARILIVEDDFQLRSLFEGSLRAAGFRVRTTATASEALEMSGASDLVILDVSLPDGEGWQVAEHLHHNHPEVAILFVTGMGDMEQKLRGFRIGADDYVVKPVELPELNARAHAVLRRRKGHKPLKLGRLSVDLTRQMVWLDRHPIYLTPLEYDLLAIFVQHPLRIWTRDELVRRVWGPERFVMNRAVDVRIRYLRQAIDDDPTQPTYIETVRGRGYRWMTEPTKPALPPNYIAHIDTEA